MSMLAVIQLGAYRSLAYKFILFFSVNVKGCIHLAVSIPKVSGFLAILTHKLLPKLRDPFLAPSTQLKWE